MRTAAIQLVRHVTPQNSEEELALTLSGLGLTRGSACPCVWRGRIKEEDVVATVHGDDITIGEQRTAVECPVKMMSKKCEIRKQVLGGDLDLEKSGRILNRVIELDRGRSEACQRDNEGRRAGASTTLCDSMCCGKERGKQGREPMRTRTDQAQMG